MAQGAERENYRGMEHTVEEMVRVSGENSEPQGQE